MRQAMSADITLKMASRDTHESQELRDFGRCATAIKVPTSDDMRYQPATGEAPGAANTTKGCLGYRDRAKSLHRDAQETVNDS